MCDGIGGTVKREAVRASLRATITEQILTPMQLFEWCSTHMTGIKFFYISKDDVALNFKLLEKRFSNATKISGIRSHHYFIPNADKTLKMRRISGDANTDEVIVGMSKSKVIASTSLLGEYILGQFILCKYELSSESET